MPELLLLLKIKTISRKSCLSMLSLPGVLVQWSLPVLQTVVGSSLVLLMADVQVVVSQNKEVLSLDTRVQNFIQV